MYNIPSQLNMLYNVKWHGMLELNVLTGNYIPVRTYSGGGGGILRFCRRYVATSTVSADT